MSLERKINELKELENELISISQELMKNGQNIFIQDLFVIGAIDRILKLSSGFRALILERNFSCSAAILRMQIDTAARLNALTIVGDTRAFCMRLFDGQRFDKQKDRSGHPLKDFHLIRKLSDEFPWVKNVYEETSDFIHLSTRHTFSAISSVNDEGRAFRFHISTRDPDRKEEDYFEIFDAFFAASKISSLIVIRYIAFRNSISGVDQK